jgi:hypothetical protein
MRRLYAYRALIGVSLNTARNKPNVFMASRNFLGPMKTLEQIEQWILISHELVAQ